MTIESVNGVLYNNVQIQGKKIPLKLITGLNDNKDTILYKTLEDKYCTLDKNGTMHQYPIEKGIKAEEFTRNAQKKIAITSTIAGIIGAGVAILGLNKGCPKMGLIGKTLISATVGIVSFVGAALYKVKTICKTDKFKDLCDYR